MRKNGHTHIDQISAAMRHHWQYGYLESYRRAAEYTQSQICDAINAHFGVNYGDPGSIDLTTYSNYERWPYLADKRRPAPIGVLVALAEFYGTTPDKLVDPAHLDLYPLADRAAILAFAKLNSGGASKVEAAKGSEPVPAPRMMEESRSPSGPPVHTPHTTWVRPDEIRSGATLEGFVRMAGHESAQYADRPSNIGENTIEQLRDETTELARGWGTTPRLRQFASLRLLRDQIFALLDAPGRVGTSPNRDLHFLAGAVCGMLATSSDELGYPSAAFSHIRVAKMLAKEAGSTNLDAWLRAEQANLYYWNGQYKRARDCARSGQDLRPTGTVAVFLPSIEARASGELNDEPASRDAVSRASEARPQVVRGELDQFGGRLGFDEARQHFYAAGAYLGIGDHPNVVTESTASIATNEALPEHERNLIDIAIAQFQAATAHVLSGDLDAARTTAAAAVAVNPEVRTGSIDQAAKRLHQELRSANVRTSQLAIETRDQIEDFLAVTPAQGLLP